MSAIPLKLLALLFLLYLHTEAAPKRPRPNPNLHTAEDERPESKKLHKDENIGVKDWISKEEYKTQLVGIGGTYGVLRDTASRQGVVESDHFPPKSIYQYSPDPELQKLAETDMPALSMKRRLHREFTTTGAKVYKESLQKTMNTATGELNYNRKFVTKLKEHMANGEYYKVVWLSVEEYRKSLGDKTHRQHNEDTFEKYKAGIYDALKVHVKLGMITEDERTKLRKEFQLDTSRPEDTELRGWANQQVQAKLNHMNQFELKHRQPFVDKESDPKCDMKKAGKTTAAVRRNIKRACREMAEMNLGKRMTKLKSRFSKAVNFLHSRNWRFTM
ncbi:hypothetical protein Fcan01_25397 [Folsomia candida]|uniref:Uncharacterized protein n=1 Tax=Folsomia candida TaxID=158441 RepID=A0A226D2Z7_FOLCA|nr:hypothetical protein Fcan01_25397 [Folsomia candida]